MIVQHSRKVVYKLALPSDAIIHLVFHVSQLDKAVGRHCKMYPRVLMLDGEGRLLMEPLKVLDHHIV